MTLDVLGALFALATQLVAGFVITKALEREEERRWHENVSRMLLFGAAGISVQLFAYHVAGIPFRLAWIAVPWWGALGIVRRRALAPRPAPRATPPHERRLVLVALVLFAGVTAVGLRLPVYGSDALHNFAIPARVFETHRSFAPDVLKELNPLGSGKTYPPLVAANEALVFLSVGDVGCQARWIKPLFSFAWLAYALLIVEVFARSATRRWAVLAALVFMLSPEAFLLATQGYADLHLTAFVLLAALEGCRFLTAPTRLAAVRFALAAGGAALAKNEGIAVAAGSALLVAAAAIGRRVPPRPALLCIATTSILALAWPALLRSHGVHSVHVGEPFRLDLDRIADGMTMVLEHFGTTAIRSSFEGAVSIGLPLALAFAFAALVMGRGRRAVFGCLGALLLHVLVYTAVLLQHPRNMAWQLNQAGERLIFHTTPWWALLFAAALAALARRWNNGKSGG